MLHEREGTDGQDAWILFVELDWRKEVTDGARAEGQGTQHQDQDQDERSRHCQCSAGLSLHYPCLVAFRFLCAHLDCPDAHYFPNKAVISQYSARF